MHEVDGGYVEESWGDWSGEIGSGCDYISL